MSPNICQLCIRAKQKAGMTVECAVRIKSSALAPFPSPSKGRMNERFTQIATQSDCDRFGRVLELLKENAVG